MKGREVRMRIPRLFLDRELREGLRLQLEGERHHYLAHVLRLRPGAELRLFDGRRGEWRAVVHEIRRRRAVLEVGEQLRELVAESGPTLYFAPPRRIRLEWLIEKAVELGVGRLAPVLTRRSVARPANLQRLRAIAVEAAEQCGRLSLPEIAPLCPLPERLAEDAPQRVLFADTRKPRGDALSWLEREPDCALLVGPEGGFTDEERAALYGRPEIRPVTLGPFILRCETAALYLLACWRAVREKRHDR